MKTIEVHVTMEEAEIFFPCDDDGQNVQASEEALTRLAEEVVKAGFSVNTEFTWHLPNVFGVRYGSNYLGCAKSDAVTFRFHSDLGDFRESDVL